MRILHQVQDGSWSNLAPQYLQRGDDAHPYPSPFPAPVAAAEGDLGARIVDHLVPRLTAATSTPDDCHFALWRGWGEFNRGAHATVTSARWTPNAAPHDERRADDARQRREEAMCSFLDSCAVQTWWGGRDMWLFDGAIDAATSISPAFTGAALWRRSPQWWWPSDRAWFLGNEIDHPWSYLAGSSSLIQEVADHPDIEGVIVDISDRW